MGDLGLTPQDLEANLEHVLELCSAWNALVLLDEADVFLEKRGSAGNDMVRNAMVCVMLRLLEYFQGVLFLTSNRAQCLDPAFESRVTIALKYEALDEKARAKVWSNLLQLIDDKDENIDVMKLSHHHMNGRQIKNAIRLAMAMALEMGEKLNHGILEKTIEACAGFQRDLENADAF